MQNSNQLLFLAHRQLPISRPRRSNALPGGLLSVALRQRDYQRPPCCATAAKHGSLLRRQLTNLDQHRD
eukprot:360103-Chlamydomonas_euryale.AAC.4